MFYKKLEYYIIFCLIKQITMVLYVSSRPTDSDKTKLFTDEQLDVLAESVCSDLHIDTNINVTEETCKENYRAPDLRISRQPSHVRIRCQTNTIMTVQIDPSQSFQLVALVPYVTNDSTVITDIEYDIIDPMHEYGEISRSPRKNYTLWSAVLKEGSPVVWRGGDKAPEYNKSMVHRTYEIKKFLRPSLNGSDVYGQFTWNTSGDGDVCFDVVYSCLKKNTVMSTKVMTKGTDEPQLEIDHLPSEDYCYINVTGLYGKTHFKYRTLSCKEINCSPDIIDPMHEYGEISRSPRKNYTLWSAVLKEGSPVVWRGSDKAPEYNKSMVHRTYEIKKFLRPSLNGSDVYGQFTWNTSGEEEEIRPEMPHDIFIEAIKDSIDTFEVNVSWPLPHLLPDSYNVTLVVRATDTNLTMVLPGDSTEAVFKDVTGEGIYYVLIEARLGKKTANTSRRAQFPDIWEEDGDAATGAGGAGRAGGAAIGVGCAAAAVLALLYRCRRRRHRVPVPPYKQDDKHSKDGDTEVLEIWRETEDRWEVRADKLLLHEVIGEGAFGVVRRATLAPHSVQVAVKMLKDFPSLDEIRSFRSEMELMKSVGVHPHLVSLVGCCSGRRPLIVAEYCSRGDLLSYLRCTWDVMLSKRNAKYYNNNIDVSDYRNDLFKSIAHMESSKLVVNKLYELQEICDKELTALDLLSFCRQIAMGMEFLAANRVVHRDLAARNILVTADRTLKIADFGLSRDVYEENQYKQKGNGKMPVKWMALESLTRRIYTTQSDVWSFGVVVWEIATVGGAPYASVPAARLPRLLRGGYRMPRPNNCSTQLYDIMLSCWRAHPRDRPNFVDLHQRLDELLNSACANQYLSLEIDADDAPATPKHHRYIKMLMRSKRGWTRGESYERPLKAPHTNHYTTPPDSLSAHPV